MKSNYDIIIVGAGHAGCESAHACAKLGNKTLLCTIDINNVAFLPCNPSIGGTAKGHLVCEVDALGGIMGKIADKTALQLRMLNEGKGPAVQSLRAQVDKNQYHTEMLKALQKIKNLEIVQQEVVGLMVENGKVVGVRLVCGDIYAKAVVLATGVYLNSKIIIGKMEKEEGPAGFASSTKLSNNLQRDGIGMRRFKTGTPPRVDEKSIDYSRMEKQDGEKDIQTFSFMSTRGPKNILPCYLTRTTLKTKQIILDNIKDAPMYSGQIKGEGPRYCPSIETKVVRFSDKDTHQVFLEPETIANDSIYLQGLSTSFSKDIQKQIVHSVIGLENASILKDAYAIEYDCINSLDLLPTLESKNIKNLFFAGQINGTSGYEEAAAQGIVAGINASRKINELTPLLLNRTNSYIGVLIDDLVTKGTNEPYRMMTSRAEHRLWLRQDNADIRLTEIGREYGLVDEKRWNKFCEKQKLIKEFEKVLKETKFKANILNEILKDYGQETKVSLSCESLIKRGLSLKEIEKKLQKFSFPTAVKNNVAVELKYSGYIAQQKQLIESEQKLENMEIPQNIDFLKLKGLRAEAQQKLDKIRPITIGQAGRISGVSPADITVLIMSIKQHTEKSKH